MSARRTAGRLLPVAFTLGTVGVLLYLLDLRRVGALLVSADPRWMALALGVALLDRLLMIAKWYPLVRVHAPALSFGRAARAYLAANFAAFFLPSTVGADGLRALALGREHGQVMEIGASIMAERLLGMLANGLLVIVSMVVALHVAVPVGPVGVLAAAVAVAALAAVTLPFVGQPPGWLRRRAPFGVLGRYEHLGRRFVSAYLGYRRFPGRMLAVAGLTLLESFAPLVIIGLVSIALRMDVGLVPLIVAVPIASLVAKLPISVAGIGPQEASLVSLLALFGVAAEAALALAILRRLIEISIAIPGGLLVRDLLRGLRSSVQSAGAPQSADAGGVLIAGADRCGGAEE